MEHPRLCVIISLFFDEFLVEKRSRAFHHVRLHVDAGLSPETHAPEHVSGHEVIALALLPPTPTTVNMLKVVKTFQPLLRHPVELLQISAAVRMSCTRARLFDAAE